MEMNIYTFETFWFLFHDKNKIRRIDKTICKNLWTKCIIREKKIKAIKEIRKHNNVYEYLKEKLNG